MIDGIVLARATLVGGGVVLAGLAARTYRAYSTTVARRFSLLLALLGGTAVCIGLTAATGVANKLVWVATNLSIALALLAFSCNYYGIELFGSRTSTAAVSVPALAGGLGTVVLILGTTTKTAGTTPPSETVAALPEAAMSTAAILDSLGRYYAAALVAVSVGVVVSNVLRYEHLDARLAFGVAVIGAWPWLGNFVVPEVAAAYDVIVGLTVLSVGYATSALVAVLVVGPLGLLASSPVAGNLGPRLTFDSMTDAVVVTDDRGRLLRVNEAARETFGIEPTSDVGRPLASVLGYDADALTHGATVALETNRGVRHVSVTRSPVTDRHDADRGVVLTLRDVTQRRTRQQRLDVLDRVLRHNLRNNATNIMGYAELLQDEDGSEEYASEIIDATENLVGFAESAREIERMLAETGSTRTADVRQVVGSVIEEVGSQYPAVEITSALPRDMSAAAAPSVLNSVLVELVENAAEHNDAEEPLVVISADTTDAGAISIVVSDNGPGIPAHEQAVLDAEREDPLHHGSGLGLWTVHWGITQLGGTLSMGENDPRGTTVTITLPAEGETPGGERIGDRAVDPETVSAA